jgi:hypothetical protein
MKQSARLFMSLVVPAFMLFGWTASFVMAQDKGKAAKAAPPSYQADPDVYKVIFEDQNFRVIELLRKKGVRDKPHGHSLPFVSYTLNDCTQKFYAADGKVTERSSKAGTVRATPVIASHSVETTGTTDCHSILVERK